MTTSFERCLTFILKQEGGFVNNPKDPGGMTNLGVTQGQWERFLGRKVDDGEMIALTPETVAPFYKSRFWDFCRCDELPLPIALCVFDSSVNQGPSPAAKILQRCLKIDVDGIVGSMTIKTAESVPIDGLIAGFCSAREKEYRKSPDFTTFGVGWLARNERCERAAYQLIVPPSP